MTQPQGPKPNTKSENSVLFALSELHKMESQRQADNTAALESARRARAQREEEERAARLEAEAHRLQVADAEARLRLQIEERERSSEGKVAQMQQELIQIRAERNVLRDKLLEPPPAPPRPPRWSGWVSSVALVCSICTLGVAGRYLWRLPQITAAAARPLHTPAEPSVAPRPAPAQVVAVAAPAPVTVAPAPVAPRPRPVHRPSTHTSGTSVVAVDKDCINSPDPLCGIPMGGSKPTGRAGNR